MSNSFRVRTAQIEDKQEIANLMFFERHVHRHLDWRHPTDWLGLPFYWILEKNNRIMGALACPQDQKEITWIRLFAHVDQIKKEDAWQMLWDTAKSEFTKCNKLTIAAIGLKNWFQELLEGNNFHNDEQILMLAWEAKTPRVWQLKDGIRIRTLMEDDLPAVASVDEAAFEPIWQNSLSMLKQAYPQVVVATVAESAEGIVGYQFSTPSPFGAHLARLAVHPRAQRQGIASALIGDLTTKLIQKKIFQLSVNTQRNNLHSLALYKKCGFQETGEEYPLYTFQVSNKEIKKEEAIEWDTVKMQ